MFEHDPNRTIQNIPSREEIASLAYSSTGKATGPALWVLHGIMGSKQNWSRFARYLSQRFPELYIITIDLRCHGETPHIQGPHTLRACVDDLKHLAQQIGSPEVIIGHSFGGKVALKYAAEDQHNDHAHLTEGSSRLKSVWTLDSPLAAELRPGHDEVARVIEACATLKMPQPNRQALIEAFDEHGFSRGIGQWMTTNIRRLLPHEERGEGFVWRFDIEGIRALISDYWRVDGWQLLSEIPPNIQLHLLRAERGMRWTEEDARRVAEIRPEAHTPVLADSGHWVHIDQLEALIEMIGQAGL